MKHEVFDRGAQLVLHVGDISYANGRNEVRVLCTRVCCARCARAVQLTPCGARCAAHAAHAVQQRVPCGVVCVHTELGGGACLPALPQRRHGLKGATPYTHMHA